MVRKGPWSEEQVDRFLVDTRVPIRLSCNGRRGHPVLASLWFVSLGDSLWCATQRSASVVSLLERDPRCAFEVAEDRPPYRGVRGQAVAKLAPDRGETVLNMLIERYLDDPSGPFAHWLLNRTEEEVAIEIKPLSMISWDYTKRMTKRKTDRMTEPLTDAV